MTAAAAAMRRLLRWKMTTSTADGERERRLTNVAQSVDLPRKHHHHHRRHHHHHHNGFVSTYK